MTLTTERQQFEEWFKFHSDEEECTDLLQKNSAGTNYLHPHTDLAWIAWKASRELLANREAQPVLNIQFKDGWPVPDSPGLVVGSEKLPDGFYDFYTTPPAPAVPEQITAANAPEVFEIAAEVERLGLRGTYGAYAAGWNACRAAMLAAAPEAK